MGTCLCSRLHVIATLAMLGCLLGLLVAPMAVTSSMIGSAAADIQGVGSWLHDTTADLNTSASGTLAADALAESLVSALEDGGEPILADAVLGAHLILEQTSGQLSGIVDGSLSVSALDSASSDLRIGSLWMLVGSVLLGLVLTGALLPMALAPLRCWSCDRCCACCYRCGALCAVLVALPLVIFAFPMLQAASLVMSDACHSPGFTALAVAGSYRNTGLDFAMPYPAPPLGSPTSDPRGYDHHSRVTGTGAWRSKTPDPMAYVTTNTLAYYFAPAELVYWLLPQNPFNRTSQALATCDGWLDSARGNSGPFISGDDSRNDDHRGGNGDGSGSVDDDLYSSRDDDVALTQPEPEPPAASLPGRYRQSGRLLGDAYAIVDDVYNQLLLLSAEQMPQAPAGSAEQMPGVAAGLLALANATRSSIQQLRLKMGADYAGKMGCKAVREAAVSALGAVCGIGVEQLLVPLTFCLLGVMVCLACIALAWAPLCFLLPSEAQKEYELALREGRIDDTAWGGGPGAGAALLGRDAPGAALLGRGAPGAALTAAALAGGGGGIMGGGGGGLLLGAALLAHDRDMLASRPLTGVGSAGNVRSSAGNVRSSADYGAINRGGSAGSEASLGWTSDAELAAERALSPSHQHQHGGGGDGGIGLAAADALGLATGPAPPPVKRAWSLGGGPAAAAGAGGDWRGEPDAEDGVPRHALTSPRQMPSAPVYAAPPRAYGASPAGGGSRGASASAGAIFSSASRGSQGGPDTPSLQGVAAGSARDVWAARSSRRVSGADGGGDGAGAASGMFAASAMEDVEAALGHGNTAEPDDDDDDDDDDADAAPEAAAAAAAGGDGYQPPAPGGQWQVPVAGASTDGDARLLLEAAPPPPPPDDPYPEDLEYEALLEL
jgi:hypothetical protein